MRMRTCYALRPFFVLRRGLVTQAVLRPASQSNGHANANFQGLSGFLKSKISYACAGGYCSIDRCGNEWLASEHQKSLEWPNIPAGAFGTPSGGFLRTLGVS